jgi:hypothetical protein
MLQIKTQLAPGDARASTKQYEELDGLYTNIIAAAFSPKLEEEERRVLEIVLRTAISVMEPMTTETLALFLNLTKREVEIALDPLRSVLNVQEGGGLVSVLHASFPDYMVDQLRAKSFHCDSSQHGEFLANRCFDVMEEQLRFNICNLESSFVFDKDVMDLEERIKSSISTSLSYSCLYWGEHLRRGGATKAVHQKLVDFLTYRLLFWMEVLNLEQHMASCGEILRQVRNWAVSELIYVYIWKLIYQVDGVFPHGRRERSSRRRNVCQAVYSWGMFTQHPTYLHLRVAVLPSTQLGLQKLLGADTRVDRCERDGISTMGDSGHRNMGDKCSSQMHRILLGRHPHRLWLLGGHHPSMGSAHR